MALLTTRDVFLPFNINNQWSIFSISEPRASFQTAGAEGASPDSELPSEAQTEQGGPEVQVESSVTINTSQSTDALPRNPSKIFAPKLKGDLAEVIFNLTLNWFRICSYLVLWACFRSGPPVASGLVSMLFGTENIAINYVWIHTIQLLGDCNVSLSEIHVSYYHALAIGPVSLGNHEDETGVITSVGINSLPSST